MRNLVVTIFKKCCDAVAPYQCVKNALSCSDSLLLISVPGASRSVSLNKQTGIIIIAFGKASLAMTSSAEIILGDRLVDGICIAPAAANHPHLPSRCSVFHGAVNNLPDEDSVQASNRAIELIRKHDSEHTIFLFLISGGGSALFCSPRGVSLGEKLATIRLMTDNSATIQQLNTIRQRLSNVKGGKTLEYIKKGKVISLIVSDNVGDSLQFIASGPTVPQPQRVVEALDVLRKLSIEDRLLPTVNSALHHQTDPSTSTVTPDNIIIANNNMAMSSLREYLSSIGYTTFCLTDSLTGDATARGRQFADLLLASGDLAEFQKKLRPLAEFSLDHLPSRLALIFSGETTVVIKGSGKGGRNQEMALSCLHRLCQANIHGTNKLLFLSFGTDGQDGPTDAAGAFVTQEDINAALVQRIEHHLERSDSYRFWSQYNDGRNHLKPGHTGTNVMDIQLVLIEQQTCT